MNISGNNTITNNVGTGSLINNGTITKASTGTTSFNLGTLTNTAAGTIKGVGTYAMNNTTFNSNGNIAPGLSPGIVNINGNQPLSASSTLQIELLDGSGAGTGHDQLVRNSGITLAGTLTVTEIGTVPNGTYTILNLTTGAVSGSFATINLPGGYTLQVNAGNVQLVKNVVLPLRFISFTAKQEANDVRLNWVTDNEINTSHFDVERSSDGVRYEKIGQVASANTGGTHNYSFTDAQPLQGTSYYRLKQVDINGSFEYSSVQRVVKNTSKEIIVLANPVASQLQLRNVVQGTRLIIVDATGRHVMAQTWNGIGVDVQKLSSGVYTILVDERNGRVAKQFIKQ
jgi:hypothetical protein